MAGSKVTVPQPFYLNTEDGKLMLEVDKIKVGERHRKSKGKMAALKKSISDVGQLQPIVVDAQCNLIAGWRRLTALTELGMDAEVTIARDIEDAAGALRAERDENTCREEFTPAEALSLANAIKASLKPAATARQKAGKKVPPAPKEAEKGAAEGPSRKLPEGQPEAPAKGRTDEQAAAVTGRSAATLRKVEKIKQIAFDQDASPASKVLAEQFWDKCQNDTEVKVDPLYKALMDQVKADKEKAAKTLETADIIKTGPLAGEQDAGDADTQDEPPAEKAPPRPRITTLISEAVNQLTAVGAVLDSVYADERFAKVAQGPGAEKIGRTILSMAEAFAKARAVITDPSQTEPSPDEVAAAMSETAEDPRFTVDPTTEPGASAE